MRLAAPAGARRGHPGWGLHPRLLSPFRYYRAKDPSKQAHVDPLNTASGLDGVVQVSR